MPVNHLTNEVCRFLNVYPAERADESVQQGSKHAAEGKVVPFQR